MPKKEEIIQVASTLFSEKGYEYTSVDEISKECGISKGTFYKYFQSKEDLVLEIFQKMPKDLANVLQRIYSSNFDTSTEKLTAFISMTLEIMLSNKTTFSLNSASIMPALMIDKLEDKLKNINLEINMYLSEFFLYLYGEDIKKYLRDFIYLFKGISFQYVQVSRFLPNVDLQKGTTFIVNIFEIIVRGLMEKQPEPFIQSDWDVSEILNEIKSPLNKGIRIQYLLEKIEHEINSSAIKSNEKDQYLKAVSLLSDECKHHEPKEFLVSALITYLKTLPSIQRNCDELLNEMTNFVHFKLQK